MKKLKFLSSFLTLILIFSLVFPNQGLALISISQEISMGKAILKQLRKQVSFVQDLEIDGYVSLVGRLLVKKGVGFSPFHFHFFVIKDDTFNAFSVPGGYIFVNSGVFEHINSEDELAGILAHEMAHNLCRHIARRIQTAEKMQVLTLAAIIAAILLGSPKVVNAVGATSIALAQTKMLAYSRADEEEADRVGFQILTKAGYNPWGMVELMKKLARQSDFAIEMTYRYLLTHPLPQERLNYLEILAKNYTKDKKPKNLICPDHAYFKRLCAKATVISKDPEGLVTVYKKMLLENEKPWIRYSLGLALEKEGFFKDAVENLKKAIVELPKRGYFLLDLAETYLKQGNYTQTLEVLRQIKLKKKAPPYYELVRLKYFYLKARAFMGLGRYKKAYNLFKKIQKSHLVSNCPDFYFYFGKVASALHRSGEAHFLFGMFYLQQGDYQIAAYHFRQALLFLPKTDKMYLMARRELEGLRH